MTICCNAAILGLVDSTTASYIILRVRRVEDKSCDSTTCLFVKKKNAIVTSFIFCTINDNLDGAYGRFNPSLRQLVTVR
jgi:hypothetical protein